MSGGTKNSTSAAGRATATRWLTPSRDSSQELISGSYPARSAAKSTKSTKASAKSAKAAKSDKGARQLTAAQRKVTKEAARKDAYLARLRADHGRKRSFWELVG